MNKKTLLFAVLVFSLALFGCDLLNNKPEIDVEQAIDDTIAYANAARLTVEVYYPESWGRSPQFGPLSTGSARQGFPFTVEFAVSAAYGFAEWRAYRTADLGDKSQAALAAAVPLSAAEATISGNADGRASVTINITEAVTLIPWCEDRPRITQSNPPLINSGISYSRGQQIKIWFAAPLDPSTVKFGGGFIEISGQTIGESSEPYDDGDTAVNENGDLTGGAAGASKFFKNPEYDAGSRTITIRPGDGGGDGTKLPPGDLVITVTVGTNVLSPNGNGMASPVNFYYRTNILEVKNIYTAENIWAIHKPLDAPSAEKFFYTGAELSRDRRMRKNASGRYEVTLYFTVQASNPTDMTDPPDKFKVAELRYANLAGGEVMSYTEEKTFPVTAVEDTGGSAGAIYRQNNSGAGGYYKITYEWATPPSQPGIFRLIVLPYRDTDEDGDYSDAGDIAPDTWGNAHAEGRFAAVVLDDQAPSGSAVISAAGSASQAASAGGFTRYNYGRDNKFLSFTANFSGIADNGGIGIEVIRASMDKPWTMDSAAKLQWQYQITDGSGTAYPATGNLDGPSPSGDAAWRTLSANTITNLDLSSAIGSKTDVRDLNLRYRDALGNVSPWSTVARIYYYEDNLVPVSVWSAVYDPDANTITVNWTNPTTDFTRAEAFYTVEGGGTTSLSVTNATTPGGAASAKIYGVPRQDVSGVQNGTPVSGGRRHDITIQAYSDTNQMDTIFKIWNFGTPEDTGSGMSVSNVYPAEEISTQAQLAAMALNNANKKYVLVNDIDLTGTWSPKGTGSGSNTFKGTFYGNGHTISGLKLSSVAITGLFGSIDGAVIRDLKVVVADTAPLSGNIQYFGGIVGYVTGSTLTNLIVEVPSGCFLGFTTTNNSMTFAGGIAGYVTNTTINNCRTAGAGTLKTATPVSGYSGATLRTGGIAGSLGGESGIQDCSVSLAIQVEGYGLSTELSGAGIVAALETSGSTLDYAVSRCRVSGDVSVTAGSNASIFAGGAVGRCSNPSLIDNLSVSGTLTMSKGALGGYNYCGGIIGNNGSTSIDACEFSGRIVIPDTFAASTTSYIGGIAGYYYTISGTSPTIGNCAARGTMYIQSRGSGQVNIGGVLGYVEGVSGDPVNVENCRYEDGDITALRTEGSGGFSVGGFAGSVGSNSIFSNCRSLAGNVSAHSYNFIYIGGFAGLLTGAAIEGCYALTDVSSTGSSTQFTGGLIGNATNNSTISRCYAAGSVRAVSTADGVTFYTGGLVGNVANTSVSDSYALGNVLADKTAGNGAVNAGGLAGNFSTTGRIIERCFSAGTVTARSAGSGIIYAGGLVAQGGTGTILKNNAALGASVTAQGPGTKNIGRVYGTWTSGTISNNHAVSTMLLFSDAYNKPYPAEATPAPASNAAGKDGADVADGSLRGQAFWTDAPSTGLGFTAGAANWNFNSVYARRYPALEGLGGQ